MKRTLFGAASALILSLAAIPAAEAAPLSVEFGGMVWNVRQSRGPTNPGPTVFSGGEDQVWVDERGSLHLRVSERDGQWTGSEITARAKTGYGTYSFDLAGGASGLDPNIVFGFFTWDDSAPPLFRELDVEIARWGVPGGPAGWFTVQPYEKAGNQRSFDLPPAPGYRFEMRWAADSVVFACRIEGATVAEWCYRGEDLPSPGRARLHFNLWLFRGNPPAGPGPYEAVVSSFSFEPSGGSEAR